MRQLAQEHTLRPRRDKLTVRAFRWGFRRTWLLCRLLDRDDFIFLLNFPDVCHNHSP